MQLVTQKAIVKCVLSGDTVVIRGKPVNGPPPEKIVSLSYLTVPKFSLKASEANEVSLLSDVSDYSAFWF
jgi:staphylococcal nuclease domain-containing protein 1